MSDLPVRFTRLNNSNYAEWALRMEAVLVRTGLWSVINVTVTTEGKTEEEIKKALDDAKKARNAGKMNEARAEIILRVDDGQLAHCMRSTDPMEIWQVLESVHCAAGFATSLALRRKFLTGKKAPEQSMQAWIGQVQALAFRLQHAGIEVSDQDKILALTMGLPPAYDPVIINFDSTATDKLTLEHVITRLLNEEVRQEAGNANEDGEALAAIRGTRTGTRQGSNPSDVTCFFCEKKGHYKSECPERLEWEKTKKGKKDLAATVLPGVDSDDDEEYGGYF